MRTYEEEAAERLPTLLAEMFGRSTRSLAPGDETHDLLLKVAGRTFAVEVKGQLSPPALHEAFKRLARARPTGSTPVIAVPALTEPRRLALRELGVNWIDFAGNAHIVGPDVFVHVEGRELQRRVGRPASLFERRSSRLVRALLLQPARRWNVKQAASAAGLEQGQTSRLLARMVAAGFLERDASRAFRLGDPIRLAEAWRDAADFGSHTLHPAHVVGRSGAEISEQVATFLQTQPGRHAATGLTAAWAYDHFAMFRLSTFYVDAVTPEIAAQFKLHGSPVEGANVWLVVPNDDGVFANAQTVDGISCVHPVQVWIDLKGHPERAAEAAEHLKAEALLGFRP